MYAHEKKVTGLIHGLMDMAKEEKDHPTEIMLQWFVNEQVEEEENAEAAVSKLKMVSGDKGLGLMYMLDQEMGQLLPSIKKNKTRKIFRRIFIFSGAQSSRHLRGPDIFAKTGNRWRRIPRSLTPDRTDRDRIISLIYIIKISSL